MTHSQSFDATTVTTLFVVQQALGFASDMKSNKWKLNISKEKYCSIEMHTHTYTIYLVWYGMESVEKRERKRTQEIEWE